MNIAEQLGNVGTEVGRALRAKAAGNEDRMWGALTRALELLDLTANDPRWAGRRRKEILRAREVTCDYLAGENIHASTPESLDRYFTDFAVLARQANQVPLRTPIGG